MLRTIQWALGHAAVTNTEVTIPVNDDTTRPIQELLRGRCREETIYDNVDTICFKLIESGCMFTPAPVTCVFDGHVYQLVCPEQYIQAQKALYLENKPEAIKILSAKYQAAGEYVCHGRTIKSPTNKVFDPKEWQVLAPQAYAKFYKLIISDINHPLCATIRRMLSYALFHKSSSFLIDDSCFPPWGIDQTNYANSGEALQNNTPGINLFGRAIKQMAMEVAAEQIITPEDITDFQFNRAKPGEPKITLFSMTKQSQEYVNKFREGQSPNDSELAHVVMEIDCSDVVITNETPTSVMGVQLVDESGSMSGHLPNTRAAIAQIVCDTKLRDGISICGFSSTARRALPLQINHGEIGFNPNSIIADAYTNLGVGLELALQDCAESTAYTAHIPLSKRMIIVMTDGAINEGVAANKRGQEGGELLLNFCRTYWTTTLHQDAESLPVIHTIGFGADYDQDLLYTLAGQRGITFHIDKNIGELSAMTKRIFGIQASTVATKVHLELPSGVQFDVSDTPLLKRNGNNKIELPDLEAGRKITFNFLIDAHAIKLLKTLQVTTTNGQQRQLPIVHKIMADEKKHVTEIIADVINATSDDYMRRDDAHNGIQHLQKFRGLVEKSPLGCDESLMQQISKRRDNFHEIRNSHERENARRNARQQVRNDLQRRDNSNSWW